MCLGQTLEGVSGRTAAEPESNRQGKLLFILGSAGGSSADDISFFKKVILRYHWSRQEWWLGNQFGSHGAIVLVKKNEV